MYIFHSNITTYVYKYISGYTSKNNVEIAVGRSTIWSDVSKLYVCDKLILKVLVRYTYAISIATYYFIIRFLSFVPIFSKPKNACVVTYNFYCLLKLIVTVYINKLYVERKSYQITNSII